jgi:hypothetical protein
MKELFVGEDDAPEIVLSGPRNFRHESHIGWDPEKGFDVRPFLVRPLIRDDDAQFLTF